MKNIKLFENFDEPSYEEGVKSNCCEAPILANTDICSKCGEHAEVIPKDVVQEDVTAGSTEAEIKKVLTPFVEQMRNKIFQDKTNATDEKVLGIILSKYLDWDPERIRIASISAFEDANDQDSVDLLSAGVEEDHMFQDYPRDQAKKDLKGLTVITDPMDIADSLGGEITGDYQKDKERSEKRYKKTYSEKDYMTAYQMHEQP